MTTCIQFYNITFINCLHAYVCDEKFEKFIIFLSVAARYQTCSSCYVTIEYCTETFLTEH